MSDNTMREESAKEGALRAAFDAFIHERQVANAITNAFGNDMSDEEAFVRHLKVQTTMFKDRVVEAATNKGWEIISLGDDSALIKVPVYEGQKQICYLTLLHDTVKFYGTTQLTYDSPDDVPHRLSTHLLSDNDTRLLGSWCLEEIDGKHTFTCIHEEKLNAMQYKNFVSSVLRVVEGSAEIDRAFSGNSD